MAGTSWDHYKKYIRESLERISFSDWCKSASLHRAVPLYVSFQCTHSQLLLMIRNQHLGWDDKLRVRSFCRSRIGAVVLGARNHKISRAHIQFCIFCDRPVRSTCTHVFSQRQAWNQQREVVSAGLNIPPSTSPYDKCRFILSCTPLSAAFLPVLKWWADIEVEALKHRRSY